MIIKVVRACVCGSDLWSYAHGDDKAAHSENSGHEALGIVEAVSYTHLRAHETGT